METGDSKKEDFTCKLCKGKCLFSEANEVEQGLCSNRVLLLFFVTFFRLIRIYICSAYNHIWYYSEEWIQQPNYN
jgi:hypothetical protein